MSSQENKAKQARTSLIREWVTKSEEDFRSLKALHLLNSESGYSNVICFLAQQCIEKLLKAWLVHYGITPPKTHDLLDLSDLLLSDTNFRWSGDKQEQDVLEGDLEFLTRAAVELRYPGKGAEKAQADLSVKLSEQLKTFLIGELANTSHLYVD